MTAAKKKVTKKTASKKSSAKQSREVKDKGSSELMVSAPVFNYLNLIIEGTAPYCQKKFASRDIEKIRKQQEAGSTAKSKKARDPKNFEQSYEGSKHISQEGWLGIPAGAFRTAMIDACRAAGIVMTRAKLAVFVEPDGYDAESLDPLVRITKGEPKMVVSTVRNTDGSTDLRPRPVWDPGWQARVTLKYDADMIAADNVVNLLLRAGMQVGIGEGRHYSRKCNGCGWGTFTVLNQDAVEQVHERYEVEAVS